MNKKVCMRSLQKLKKSSETQIDVVKVILHAATTSHPKLRYPVGKGVGISTLFKRILPWRLWEKIMLKRSGA